MIQNRVKILQTFATTVWLPYTGAMCKHFLPATEAEKSTNSMLAKRNVLLDLYRYKTTFCAFALSVQIDALMGPYLKLSDNHRRKEKNESCLIFLLLSCADLSQPKDACRIEKLCDGAESCCDLYQELKKALYNLCMSLDATYRQTMQ